MKPCHNFSIYSDKYLCLYDWFSLQPSSGICQYFVIIFFFLWEEHHFHVCLYCRQLVWMLYFSWCTEFSLFNEIYKVADLYNWGNKRLCLKVTEKDKFLLKTQEKTILETLLKATKMTGQNKSWYLREILYSTVYMTNIRYIDLKENWYAKRLIIYNCLILY